MQPPIVFPVFFSSLLFTEMQTFRPPPPKISSRRSEARNRRPYKLPGRARPLRSAKIESYARAMGHVKEGPRGVVILDDRYAPLVISSFSGEIDLPLAHWFEATLREVVHREFNAGRKIVHIHDTSRITTTKPEMRKFWAEFAERNHGTLDLKTLGNPVVVTSALMRGVLTAIGWLNPRASVLEIFPSLDAALRESLRRLEGVGTPVVLPLGGYSLPPEVAPSSLNPASRSR